MVAREVLLHGSVLEFGTELVVVAIYSLVALLGASPGDFGTILCASSGRRDTYPQAGLVDLRIGKGVRSTKRNDEWT